MGILQKMNYREKSYRCGQYIHEYIYPVWQTGRKVGRRKKRKESREAQRKLNIRHTQEKCTRLLDANFSEKDLSIGLSYAEQPDSIEQVKRDWNNFSRKLKRRYEKLGIEYKYLTVPEVSGRGRYHLHAVIPGGIDRDEVEKLWGHGWANTKRLQPDEFGLDSLAKYMTKSTAHDDIEQISKKAYWASKNLIDPPPKTNDSKIKSRRQACELGERNTNAWKKLYPEYTAVEIERFMSDEYGYIYLFAKLRKDPHPESEIIRKGKRKKKGSSNHGKTEEDRRKAGQRTGL